MEAGLERLRALFETTDDLGELVLAVGLGDVAVGAQRQRLGWTEEQLLRYLRKKAEKELFDLCESVEGEFKFMERDLPKLDLLLGDFSSVESKKELTDGVTTLILAERKGEPRTTNLFIKGDFTRPGERVSPGVPAVWH